LLGIIVILAIWGWEVNERIVILDKYTFPLFIIKIDLWQKQSNIKATIDIIVSFE